MSDEVSHGFGAAIVPDDGLSEEVDVDLDDTTDGEGVQVPATPPVANSAGAKTDDLPPARPGSSSGLAPPPEGARGSDAGARGSDAGARGSDAGVRGSDPGARTSERLRASDAPRTEPKKARPRLSLRVPDDEIVRPQSQAPAARTSQPPIEKPVEKIEKIEKNDKAYDSMTGIRAAPVVAPEPEREKPAKLEKLEKLEKAEKPDQDEDVVTSAPSVPVPAAPRPQSPQGPQKTTSVEPPPPPPAPPRPRASSISSEVARAASTPDAVPTDGPKTATPQAGVPQAAPLVAASPISGLPPMAPVAAPPPPPPPPRPRMPSSTDIGHAPPPPLPPPMRPRAQSVTTEMTSGLPAPAPPPPATPPASPPPVAPAPVATAAPAAPAATVPASDPTPSSDEIKPARIISVAPPPAVVVADDGLDAPDDVPTLTDLRAVEGPRDRDSSDGIPIVEDVEPTFELRPKPTPQESRVAPPPENPPAPATVAAAAPATVAVIVPNPETGIPEVLTASAQIRAPALTIPDADGIDIPVDEDAPVEPTSSESEVASDDLLSVETPLPAVTQNGGMMRAALPIGMSSEPNVGEHLSAQTPPGGITAQPQQAAASRAPVHVPPPPPRGSPGKTPLVIVPPHASPLAPQPMTDAAAARKRTRPWWEDLFNDDFIRTMAKITDGQIAREVDFIEDSLGVARGAMILDMACGTGRHAIELTRRGYRVVGLDLSLAMLAKAAEEAQERDQKLNFVQGDMRDMTFEDMFDGVFCWNTSFGYFEEEKNAHVIQRVHRALRKGGQFVLDVINRDFAGQQAPSIVWFEGDGCICMDEMQIDWITSRMRVKRTMMMDDGRSREIEYSLRVYSLHELGKLLHDHGFRVAEVSGRIGTPGVFFGSDSPNVLILAEKR